MTPTPTFDSPFRPLTGLAALALTVSLIFHAALLRINPSILLTGGAGFASPERTMTFVPLTLESLRPHHPPAPAEEPVLDFSAVEGDHPLMEDPPSISGPLPEFTLTDNLSFASGEGFDFLSAPAGVPAVPSDGAREGWQPRAELLAIREQRVTERPEAPPRRITRRMETPNPESDIFLPVEDIHTLAPAPSDFPSSGFSGLPAPLSRPGLAGITGTGDLGRELQNLLETQEEPEPYRDPAPSTLRGHTEDLMAFDAPAIAADQLLRIHAQSYVNPSRPDYRYFKLQLRPSGREELERLPRELIFLLDAGGRISTEVFQQAATAVTESLHRLDPEDRFNILLLQQQPVRLFEESQAASPVQIARTRGRLAQIRPQGAGDLTAGLTRLLEMPRDTERLRIGVLVTDGVPSLSLEASTAYLETFTRQNQGEISIFTVGIGRQVNRYLIDFLSFRNRGDSLVTEQARQIGPAILRTVEEIRRPVLRHLTHRFVGGDPLSVYPRSLTHLYLDRPLILVGRIPADQQTVTFQLVGHSGAGAHDMVHTLDVDQIPPGPWSLRQDWAWQALLDRAGNYLRNPNRAALEAMEMLMLQYGVRLPDSFPSPGPEPR